LEILFVSAFEIIGERNRSRSHNVSLSVEGIGDKDLICHPNINTVTIFSFNISVGPRLIYQKI